MVAIHKHREDVDSPTNPKTRARTVLLHLAEAILRHMGAASPVVTVPTWRSDYYSTDLNEAGGRVSVHMANVTKRLSFDLTIKRDGYTWFVIVGEKDVEERRRRWDPEDDATLSEIVNEVANELAKQ